MVFYSEYVNDFSLNEVVEYDNPTNTRMALANTWGGNVHVCHELTKCRDNLQWALRTRMQLEHAGDRESVEEEWDEGYAENNGVCMSVYSDDDYGMHKFSLVIYSDADMGLILKRLNFYAKLAKMPKFTLTELGYDDKYGESPLYLLESGAEWNSPLLFSFATFAVRFHAEMPSYCYLTSTKNYPNVDEEYWSEARHVSETVSSFVNKTKHCKPKHNWVRLYLAKSNVLKSFVPSYKERGFFSGVYSALNREGMHSSDSKLIQGCMYD